uniref:Peptidyl-prolyl cis-trans isomerase n=1 Tax=Theileria parva TaxID=5875 RepID=Q4N6R7_THEPA|eukprot:XP_766624.1 cyclophilin [Theileria parva strain Muguga]
MSDDKNERLLGGPPYLSHLLTNPDNPVVFMDISLGSQYLGRLKIELFADKVPKTCENFRKFCTGEHKQNMVPVGYKGTKFSKVIKDYMVQVPMIIYIYILMIYLIYIDLIYLQGGDFAKGDGTGCISIYGSCFDDENFSVKHDKLGIISMSNTGPNTNGCQFFFITKECDWLDGKNVAFGSLVDDESKLVLQKMQNVSVGENYAPKLNLLVTECGQL